MLLSPLTLTLAVLAGSAEVDCQTQVDPALQPGELITAVRCEDRTGFFVPSLRFRELYRAEQNETSYKREIEILEGINDSLTKANKALAKTASAAQSRADRVETSWKEAEDALTEANKEVRELSKGGQWSTFEVVVFVGVIVGGVVFITYAVNQDRGT